MALTQSTMLYRTLVLLAIVAQTNALACNLSPRPAPRSAVLRMEAASPTKAATVTMDAAAENSAPAAAVEGKVVPLDPRAQLDKDLSEAVDNKAVLTLVKANIDTCTVNSMAAALKKLAIINKKRRAGRDALLRDTRFEMLIDGIVAQSKDLEPAYTADVLWSSATLQHWPATMLSPVLTSVAVEVSACAAQSSPVTVPRACASMRSCVPRPRVRTALASSVRRPSRPSTSRR